MSKKEFAPEKVDAQREAQLAGACDSNERSEWQCHEDSFIMFWIRQNDL